MADLHNLPFLVTLIGTVFPSFIKFDIWSEITLGKKHVNIYSFSLVKTLKSNFNNEQTRH